MADVALDLLGTEGIGPVMIVPKSTGKELMKSITYGIPKFRVFPTPVNSGLWRGASGPAVGLTYPSLHLMGERPRLKGR
jgi:hypothetical protein